MGTRSHCCYLTRLIDQGTNQNDGHAKTLWSDAIGIPDKLENYIFGFPLPVYATLSNVSVPAHAVSV